MSTLTNSGSKLLKALLSATLLAAAPIATAQTAEFPAAHLVDASAAVDVPSSAPADFKLSKDDRKKFKYDVSKIGVRDVGKGMNFYSMEAERMMGRQLADQVDEQAKVVKDPALNAYIQEVCRRLVAHSDAKFPFTVKILEDDEINAFALPGGYFYVNSGLIMAADSEAELAGVMAHEIAHVAARHASRTATKGQIFNLASLPLVFISGPAGMAIQQLKGIAVPLTFLKFSRDAEREADMLGLQYQYAAGYDPQGFVEFFEKLQKTDKKKGMLGKAFSTHPMNDERIQRAKDEIATMLPTRDNYIWTTSAFEDAKARLTNLLSGHPANTSDKPVLHRAMVEKGNF